ncbi:galactose-3-O-sulfotransferase 3-like [Apostichopus japonicus]|uniref:galactose-3-O-sulfotransferase 3-like n=1 Tax=Stichopus japonicus TaxID=307972 RepID=UPI003AB88E20
MATFFSNQRNSTRTHIMMGVFRKCILLAVGSILFIYLLYIGLNSRTTQFFGRPAELTVRDEHSRSDRNSKSSSELVYPSIASFHDATQQLSTNSCTQQLNSVAFVKTFKTGSSTLASILARYGYERNLSFALPKSEMFLSTTTFNPKTSNLLSMPKPPGFHILNNHAIFNKTGFQEVMRPETKYITILRAPIKTFYSFIAYFQALKSFNFTGDIFSPDFPMQSFLNVVGTKRTFRSGLLHNGQMFSLGFDTYTQSNDEDAVAKKISQLDLELDLVLINEYYDESLIILKKMMCWQFEDILYISNKISGTKYNFPEEHVTHLRKWTAADSAL